MISKNSISFALFYDRQVESKKAPCLSAKDMAQAVANSNSNC